MKKVTACPRLMQTIFREVTPACGSPGCWPKAVACSRGDGLCQHTRHQEGPPAWDTSVDELISSQWHTARLRLQACCRGRWYWLRQAWKRFDQSHYFCTAAGFSPYFALQAEPHSDRKKQPSLQTVLSCEHIAFLQRDQTEQLRQLLALCSAQYLPYLFIFKI